MTRTTTKYANSTSNHTHEIAKRWLQRQLEKATSRHKLKDGGETKGIRKHGRIEQLQAVPSVATTSEQNPKPFAPVQTARAFHTSSIQPLSSVSRTDPGVVHNVNAWLDASMSTSSPPLMGGLTYWRMATAAGAKDSAELQHAIPIVQEPQSAMPFLRHGSRVKSFHRRAKRMQVQMPSLSRTKRKGPTGGWEHAHHQSTSVPVIAVSYQETQQGELPVLMTRSRSLKCPAVGAKFHDASNSIEGRINSRLRPIARSLDSTRCQAAAAAAGLMREDSMGNLSDAPTYFTGLPPPSYQSRTASILTVSSFGCVDGMNAEHRQISQQRAARERGMRGKLRRFAENFAT